MATIELALGGTLKLVAREIEEIIAIVTLTYDRFTVNAQGDTMAYTLPADKQVEVKVSYIDGDGNPAAVDGPVTWQSSDDNIAQVIVDSQNSTHAIVRPSNALGQVQVSVTADADLGEGTRELITTMDVEIVAGEAVAGTIEPVGPPGPITP